MMKRLVSQIRSKRKWQVTAGILIGMALFGVGVFSYVLAMEDLPYGGTTAPGSHEWWDLADPEETFCSKCHSDILVELTSGQHKNPAMSACSWCHGAAATGHVAQPALCADCHSSEAGEVDSDAHGTILTQLGEDTDTASWTCKACHTHVAITIDITPKGPLPLKMEP